MSLPSFLESVMAAKREEMRQVSTRRRDLLWAEVQKLRCTRGRFARALSAPGVNIIAEFKRRSPSKGAIQAAADPVAVAVAYRSGGAAAISVLTEPEHFGGSMHDLATVHGAVSLPLLRKDFIVHEYQLHEAALAGAEAALLIVAGLSDQELRALLASAEAAGLDALVEVHAADEMRRATEAGARLIGVNNRDLGTLEVRLETSLELAPLAPAGATLVSESGLCTVADLRRLSDAGYKAFLIGETFMRAADPAAALRELRGEAASTRAVPR